MSESQRGHTTPLSIAPMMDRTDRHYRFILRQITKHTLLYTEMVTTGAILHGDRDALLGYSDEEHPVALQLGGDDPQQLAECASVGEDLGYDEINLNVGCPSSRVQSGCFGAVLMRRPERVAEAIAAMRAVVSIPVTVKHRIGVDELDRYEDMANFVAKVEPSGADRFTVHARKAWLSGLSPKANRNIPPLRYDDVHRLKQDFPHLSIEINGGIKTLDAAATELKHVDAVMIGRAAADTPWIFADADRRFFGDDRRPELAEIVAATQEYAARFDGNPRTRPHHITRHLLPLLTGLPGARAWRRTLTERASESPVDVLSDALSSVPPTTLERLRQR